MENDSKLEKRHQCEPESMIQFIRGKWVIIDRDLADLYGVSTKALNQQVKRNIERFPANFMFRLNEEEFLKLVTICDRFKCLKHSAVTPHAFTEQAKKRSLSYDIHFNSHGRNETGHSEA